MKMNIGEPIHLTDNDGCLTEYRLTFENGDKKVEKKISFRDDVPKERAIRCAIEYSFLLSESAQKDICA